MIVRHFQLILAVHLVCIVTSQNARSYDTSDWVPITQKTGNETPSKRATGRVLNLDAPAKNFFPDDDYSYRKHRPLPSSYSKTRDRYNVPKYEDNNYMFELPHPSRPKGKPQMQYFTNQEVKLPNYEQPPPLDAYRSPSTQHHNQQMSVPNTRERAPAPNAASIYDKYTIPFNNPGILNEELLGALKYQENLGFVDGIRNNQQAVAGDVSMTTVAPLIEKERVELVYVPLENLKPNQPITQDSQAVYKQVEAPRYNDNLVTNNNVNQITAIQRDFIEQALRATKLQQQFEDGQSIQLQPLATTTAKPSKKRRPHQPPLAVYMEGHQPAEVEDVLEILKGAKSISVQDSVQPDSPQIFIGPTSLNAPDGYSKFPLPYLNNIDGNRIEKKIEKLPFFVAPLSFKTPPGYSKIPLPAPHVGSVVVSNKEDPQEQKRSTPDYNSIKSVTPSSTYNNDNPSTQTYQSQDYYNPVQLISSPQPQLLQFDVNNNNEEYPVTSRYYQQSSNNQYYSPQVGSDQRYTQADNIHNHYSSSRDNSIRTTPRYTDQSSSSHVFTTPTNQEADVPSRTSPSRDTYSIENSGDHLIRTEQNHENNRNPQYTNEQNFRNPHSDMTLQSLSNTEKYDESTKSPIASVTQEILPEREQQKIRTLDVNPLELAINEFELHQINSQLEDKPRVKNQYDYDSDEKANQRDQSRYRTRHPRPQTTTEEYQYKFDPELHRFSSSPASILRDTNMETTVRPISNKSRRRGRPTRPTTTTTTTPVPTERESYTVLEEFSIKPKTPQYSGISQYTDNSQYPTNSQYTDTPKYPETPQYPEALGVQYVSENGENPVSVYTLRTATPSYNTATDVGVTRTKSTYDSDSTIIEDLPANVYELKVNKNSQAHGAPVYNEDVSAYTENFQSQNQQTLNQNSMDQQILQNVFRQNAGSSGGKETYHGNSEQSNIEPLVYNRGQYQENQEYQNTQADPGLNSGMDINYEDPSVRSLLVPNLLVPRGPETDYSAPKYLPTTEAVPTTTPTTTTTTSTTERYIETSTQTRPRGRQRGGNRYNVPTRRTPTRRRPNQVQRTTTERSSYTAGNSDSQRTRQRFRTRGRTTPNNFSEIPSTTTEHAEHDGPTSESGIRYINEPQNHVQFEDDGNIQQISSVRPDAEYVSDQRHQIVGISQPPQLQYEDTPTSRPIVEQPVHNNVRAQSHNIIQRTEENPRESVKIRGRVRGRSRPAPTTTEEVATIRSPRPVQNEEKEEEFYGFFRKPNFSQSPVHQSDPISSTSEPKVHYESTPSQLRDDVRLQYDNTKETYSTTTPRFVGELVPKYHTPTTDIEREETETPRPRIRARTRIPQRHTGPRVSPNAGVESSTRISNTLRSRGRSHYKVPENMKKKKEDDTDGENYPAEFFQNKHQFTTRTPSFRITVAPDEEEDEDQVPHHSLYRPNYFARPEEWHEASQYDAGDGGQNNSIGQSQTDENSPKTTEQPVALPIKSSMDASRSYESTYREASKAMEGIFEAINEKYATLENPTTTEEPVTKGRRRGVWKLVKQRPVDRLEVAESQNYYSVLNSFDEIKKIDADRTIEHHSKTPVDTSESQAYYSVLNSYDDLRKVNSTEIIPKENPVNETDSILVTLHSDDKEDTNTDATETDPTTTAQPAQTITDSHGDDMNTDETFHDTTNTIETTSQLTKTTTTEDSGFFKSLYDMLGVSGRESIWGVTTLSPSPDDGTETSATTIVTPSFPEEITEEPSTTANQNATESLESTTGVDTTTYTSRSAQKVSNFEVEPWEMKAVRTSTSTEVSHETEICYKGRCIKAADKKKKL